jgi:hypothetical protein
MPPRTAHAARSFALLAIVSSFTACADAPPPATPTAPLREPEFADHTKRAEFDRGRKILAEMRASTGHEMTLSLASELGFKCADLRGVKKSLAAEKDPLVSRVIADVDKMCGLDVPLATAQLEVQTIEEKRRRSANAGGAERPDVKRECKGLEIALGEMGAQYTSNPDVVEVGGKYAEYCP